MDILTLVRDRASFNWNYVLKEYKMYNHRVYPERSRTKRRRGREKKDILSSPKGENRKECSAGGSGFYEEKGGYNQISGKCCLLHFPLGDSQSH